MLQSSIRDETQDTGRFFWVISRLSGAIFIFLKLIFLIYTETDFAIQLLPEFLWNIGGIWSGADYFHTFSHVLNLNLMLLNLELCFLSP